MAEEKQMLTMESIEKSNEKYKNVKEVDIHLDVDGEIRTFTLEVYKVFSPVGIKNCIAEFIKNLDVAKDISPNGLGGIMEPYLMYLMIKNFTSLGEYMPDNLKSQLISLNEMMNSTALFQIMVHFDEGEIERIKDELEIALNTFEDNLGIVEDMKKQVRGMIVNKDLLE